MENKEYKCENEILSELFVDSRFLYAGIRCQLSKKITDMGMYRVLVMGTGLYIYISEMVEVTPLEIR